jgi:hypothetical protein
MRREGQTIANFTSSRPSAPSHCRTTTTQHTRYTAATMSDNENGNDNGEEMVTKPFKFVTGEFRPRLRYL